MPRLASASLWWTGLLVGCASTVERMDDDGSQGPSSGGAPVTSSVTSTSSGGTGGSEPVSTTSSGGTGTGGSEPVPRELPIAFVSYDIADPDALLVLVNHADGTLVTSYLGSELPTETTVTDGDTVTYVYLANIYSAEGQAQQIQSYRVTPELTQLEIGAMLHFDPQGGLECLDETMHVTVHVPAVPGGTVARVGFANGRVSMPQPIPGDIEYDVPACGLTQATMPVLVTVSGNEPGFVAFEMLEEVPFEIGGSVELTPTFATAPRATLNPVDDVVGATGWAGWYGLYDPFSEEHSFLFTPNESGFDASFTVDGPFSHSAAPMDLPYGIAAADLQVRFPPAEAACWRGAQIARVGKSETVIPFYPSELAEPLEDGDAWKLGEGAIGDVVRRIAFNGVTIWQSFEDPARPPMPAVFPEFPSTLPIGFTLPSGDFTVRSYTHQEDDTLESYADAWAVYQPWQKPSTVRSRSRFLVCE
jgi:hypothetical protein